MKDYGQTRGKDNKPVPPLASAVVVVGEASESEEEDYEDEDYDDEDEEDEEEEVEDDFVDAEEREQEQEDGEEDIDQVASTSETTITSKYVDASATVAAAKNSKQVTDSKLSLPQRSNSATTTTNREDGDNVGQSRRGRRGRRRTTSTTTASSEAVGQNKMLSGKWCCCLGNAG